MSKLVGSQAVARLDFDIQSYSSWKKAGVLGRRSFFGGFTCEWVSDFLISCSSDIANFKQLKGQLGVPLAVYPWYLLCSLGILGDYNP